MDFLKVFLLPFKALKLLLFFLFKQHLLKRTEGATLAPKKHYKLRLHPRNTGLLLDGENLKLSELESFQNVAVIARVGAGKTSRYIIPNVLERAKYPSSIVVNDPKGEVYNATSGYMHQQGFRILVIDPEHPETSECFNPLNEAKNEIELDQIAEILIKAGKGMSPKKDSSEFWAQGAMRFVSVFLGCLHHAGRDHPGYNTLANLYSLFQHFGEDGKQLDAFMAKYSVNPDHPRDERLWNEWKGVLTGNKEGIQSFVLNALTALSAMRQKNLCQITSTSTFSLDSLRKQKTILYFITPPQHQEYYGFLTSLFFRMLLNMSMRETPNKNTLPLYILYDEFGHSTLPNFVSTVNTIRSYKVSLSIVLQSIAQLTERYGRETAQSIQGGFNTAITYAGADPETASYFERIIGKTRVYQYQDPTAYNGNSATSHIENYREQNLMNANEIRTMHHKQTLIVSSNQNAILIPSKAYFEVGWMKRATKVPPLVREKREVGEERWVGV